MGSDFDSDVNPSIRPKHNARRPGGYFDVSALDSAIVRQLVVSDDVKSSCEDSNCNSSGGPERRRNPIEDFSNLPERDKGYIVDGAVFVCLVFIAIVYFCRDKSK